MEDKEEYAKRLMSRAELGLKIMKILFIASCATALGFVVFAIVSACVGITAQGRIIGYIVFVAVIAVLMGAVAAAFFVTKSNLGKLKKLK